MMAPPPLPPPPDGGAVDEEDDDEEEPELLDVDAPLDELESRARFRSGS